MSDPTYFRIVKTAEGEVAFVAGAGGLLRSWLPGGSATWLRERVAVEFPDAVEKKTLMPEFAADLKRYFAGHDVRFRVALDWGGLTDFQKKVYRALRRIPAGRTTTYGTLAEKAGSAGAARGVGSAMARNPFPPVVPCHRVLGSGGRLTGFTAEGGLPLKQRMLESEGAL